MAIYKELWLTDIQEYLTKDNSVLTKSVNDSSFVSNNRIYLPQAGLPSGVVKNPNTASAAAVTTRTDTTIDYTLDVYVTNPLKIDTQTEGEWLSYDKRASVWKQNMAYLMEKVADDTIYKWANGADSGETITTTGTARAPKATFQSGNRSGLTYNDVLNAARKLNKQNVPMEGRILLVDADLLSDIVLDSQFHYSDELARKVATDGFVGVIAGFQVFVRSTAVVFSGNTIVDIATTPTASCDLGAIAYHPNYVRRAITSPFIYANENDPTFYGSIFSFGYNAGASLSRGDKKGIVLIKEGK